MQRMMRTLCCYQPRRGTLLGMAASVNMPGSVYRLLAHVPAHATHARLLCLSAGAVLAPKSPANPTNLLSTKSNFDAVQRLTCLRIAKQM